MEIFLYNNRIQGHFRLKKSKQTRVRTRRKGEAVNILKAEILAEGDLQEEVKTACGSDMMSDVLAFVKDQSVLLTGLVNPQVVRTAEMMDMHCIIFVRGKRPDETVLSLARQKDITILATPYRMFTACGLLYENGLEGGCDVS